MKEKSFTIIELLVVIAIIGLISSVILVNIGLPGQKQRARVAKSLEFSSSIQNSLGIEAVGIWNFDNNTSDTSGYGNNGTLYNFVPPYGYTTDTPQKIVGSSPGKYALSFDGADDYVDAGNGASLNITGKQISIEAWIKPNVVSGNWVVVKNQGYGLRALVSGSTLIIRLYIWYGVDSYVNTNIYTSYTAGSWYHFVGTYDGFYIKSYLNGQIVGTPQAETRSIIGDATTPVYLGRVWYASAEMYKGTIDEVRIYNRALSIGQIQKHYAEGLGNHQYAKSTY